MTFPQIIFFAIASIAIYAYCSMFMQLNFYHFLFLEYRLKKKENLVLFEFP